MLQKTVYIIRHAKTESGVDKPDFNRDLTDKGIQAAKAIGKRLVEREIFPDLIIASTANRAAATASILAEQLTYNKKHILWNQALYLSDATTIEEVIQSLPDEYHTIFLVAHNFGITDYVNEKIEGFAIDNLPTAGIVGFQLPINAWKENTSFVKGKFLYYDAPKLIK